MYQVNDPAVAAAEAAKSAELRFLSLPARSFIDELTTSFANAESEWEAADEAFADTVPITAEGALVKLRAIADLLDEFGHDSLELRHIRSLATYMAQLAAQPRM
jgi:hypothetical protein